MRRTLVAATAAVAALLVPFAGLAGAGGPLPDFDIDPTSGPPGTVITASGDCSVFLALMSAPRAVGDEPATPAGIIASVDVELSGPGGVLDSTTVEAQWDGTWEAEVTVPDGTPEGEYDVDAACIFGGYKAGAPRAASLGEPARPAGAVALYATQTFTVTAQPVSTSTTTSTSSTEGPTSTTRPAAAAQAVRAAPSFTG